MRRPADVTQLGPVLDRLVTFGGVRIGDDWSGVLTRIGVAKNSGDGSWMYPTQHFLKDALPARDTLDLLRRAVLRDPLYRLHIDLSLCSVVHSVATAERWPRLEELLFGPCRPVMPRLAQLLAWLAARAGRAPRELTPADWSLATINVDASWTVEWDKRLWGVSRGSADLFPLLLDLYLPLASQPVYVPFSESVEHKVLARLVEVASEGEGLTLPLDHLGALKDLQNAGIPIRVQQRNGSALVAYLVAPVVCECDEAEGFGDFADVSNWLPSSAKRSYLVPVDSVFAQWSVGRVPQQPSIVPVSIRPDAGRWPSGAVEDAPDWLPLPGAEVLASAGKRRRDSMEADAALSQLAAHPLYGFLMQVLLLEALDRELGEETLALALPQNRKLESVNEWQETRLLYRPKEHKKADPTASRDNGFLVLGRLDEVLGRVAHELGIVGVATPYETTEGPWSRALYLMSTASLVDGRPDRWTLTITNFIFDRLHSGALMHDVIRGGRAVREQIHGVLKTLWKERTKNNDQERISA